MNRHSVFVKITLVFLLSLVMLLALGGFLYKSFDRRAHFAPIRKAFLHREQIHEAIELADEQSKERLQKLDIELIVDQKIVDEIREHGTLLEKVKSMPFEIGGIKIFEPDEVRNRPHFDRDRHEMHEIRQGHPVIYHYKGDDYVQIEHDCKLYMIRDIGPRDPLKKYLNVGFIAALILLAVLYIGTIRSVYPLKRLQQKVRSLADGDLTVSFESEQKDEIGLVSNTLNEAVQKIRRLTLSRELFLKNAAHELKTPITTGKIAIELLDESRTQEILKNVFSRLQTIVTELLAAEQLCHTGAKENICKCSLKELLEEAASRLFLTTRDYTYECDGEDSVYVDKSLFIIVLKNLLDNAVKFSDDKKAEVSFYDGVISIANRSQPITASIDKLFEPFYKETSEKNKDGMGLGLYLVKSILDAFGMSITHEYADGKNIFKIEPPSKPI